MQPVRPDGCNPVAMFRRHRLRDLALVAIGLIVAGFYTYSIFDLVKRQQDGAAQIERQAGDDQRKRTDAIANCSTESSIKFAVCINDAYASYEEAQRSHQDLQAQKDSARAAFWTFVVGGAQALLGIIGIYFVASTLDETRKANEGGVTSARAANRSASAAYEAAQATREAANNARIAHLRDVRPWVRVTFDQAYSLFREDGIMECRGSLVTHNIGRSPAVELRHASRIFPNIADSSEMKRLVRLFAEQDLNGVLNSTNDVALGIDGHDEHSFTLTFPIEQTDRCKDHPSVEWRQVVVILGVAYKSLYEDQWRVSIGSYRFTGMFKDEHGRPHTGAPNAYVSRLDGGDLVS